MDTYKRDVYTNEGTHHLSFPKCPDVDVLDCMILETTPAALKGEPTPSQAKLSLPLAVQAALLRSSISASRGRSC